MGLFNKLFGSKKTNLSNKSEIDTNVNNFNRADFGSTISLSLTKEESLKTLNLRKDKLNSLCLDKKELTNLTSRVAVVMDYSYSMVDAYQRGVVQKILERLLPLALKFDDNGELETWLFSGGFVRLENITIDNYYNYIENEKILKKHKMGGTSYCPVMQDVVKKYTVEEPCDLPTYVIFITDGENDDRNETTDFIIKNCTQPIFWQFVGINNSSFKYLETLDEMEGREVDNANFFQIKDLINISDEELYSKLLQEYPSWLQVAKNKNII